MFCSTWCLSYATNNFTDAKFFSLSLVVLGNNTEFEKAVFWLSENLTFDVDARVNLFEV